MGPALKVLLVEDHLEYRRIVFEILTEAGFEVVTAENSWDALGLLEPHSEWHALVTDWSMPQGGGSALLLRLQSLPITFSKKIVFSAHDWDDRVEFIHFRNQGVRFLHKINDGVERLIQELC